MKVDDARIEARILERAEALLFQKGLQRWNMDQLAAQAGLAKKTLYKIVGSKEALIQRIVINKIFDIQRTLQGIIETEPDFFIALNKFICAYPRILSLSSGTFGEVYKEYPAIEEQVISRRRELAAYLYDFVQSGKESGKLRPDIDPELLILTLQAILLHFIKHERESTKFVAKLQLAIEYVFRGVENS